MRLLTYLQELYHAKELKGAKYAGAFMSRNPIFLAHDPDFIKDVLIKDFQYFSDRGKWWFLTFHISGF